jgi:hypothetical protein
MQDLIDLNEWFRHAITGLSAGPKAGRENEEHWDEHCTNSTENPKHTSHNIQTYKRVV